jgi:2-oxoisovalerate dehydrogenase E1 component alpha subunit
LRSPLSPASQSIGYRVSHHSTSDDSSAYRSTDEVNQKKLDSPIFRLRKYLESLSPPLWSTEKDNEVKDSNKKAILKEFSKAEKEKKPRLEELFGDVFAPREGEAAAEGVLERPQREQKAELKRLIERWGESKAWKKELEKFEGGGKW